VPLMGLISSCKAKVTRIRVSCTGSMQRPHLDASPSCKSSHKDLANHESYDHAETSSATATAALVGLALNGLHNRINVPPEYLKRSA
jgi:hypothetical protein